MKIIVWKKLTTERQRLALARPNHGNDAELATNVAAILRGVRKRGDAAVRAFSLRFDGVKLKNIRVKPQEIASSIKAINSRLWAAMKRAKANIAKFHVAERPRI